MASIKSHRELRVYQMAMDAAMRVFELTKGFPAEERFSMVDQVRRSSRSVCANIAEAWRRRRYEAHFVSKLNDAECEAEELDDLCNRILGQLVRMISRPDQWTVHRQKKI
jgi:four helix bundle protein